MRPALDAPQAITAPLAPRALCARTVVLAITALWVMVPALAQLALAGPPRPTAAPALRAGMRPVLDVPRAITAPLAPRALCARTLVLAIMALWVTVPALAQLALAGTALPAPLVLRAGMGPALDAQRATMVPLAPHVSARMARATVARPGTASALLAPRVGLGPSATSLASPALMVSAKAASLGMAVAPV